jgi:thiol-disulfide isomerase/thioredoxin
MDRDRAYRVLGNAALVSAVLIIALMARQHRDLSRRYRETRIRAASLTRGDAVPRFRTASVGGDSMTIGESRPGERQFIFLLTKECPYCRATLPVWKEIADRVGHSVSSPVKTIAIALDSLAEMPAYLADHGLRVPIVQFPDRRTRSLFRAGVVPQTLVVSDSGTVLYSHIGLIANAATRDSIVSAILDAGRLGDASRSK